MKGLMKKLGDLIKCTVYLLLSICNFKKKSENPILGKVSIAGRTYQEIKLISQGSSHPLIYSQSIGGYAYVYKVQDVKSKEIYALKQMICQVSTTNASLIKLRIKKDWKQL